MTSLRRRLELKTGPLVILLHRMPRVVPFLLVAALLLAGLGLKGVAGALLLLVLAAFLGLLLLLSWPVLPANARLLRLATLALVVATAFTYL